MIVERLALEGKFSIPVAVQLQSNMRLDDNVLVASDVI